MSTLPPKADIRPRDQDVCFGPISDIAPIYSITSSAATKRGGDELGAEHAHLLKIR